jgi:hypothetical protein
LSDMALPDLLSSARCSSAQPAPKRPMPTWGILVHGRFAPSATRASDAIVGPTRVRRNRRHITAGTRRARSGNSRPASPQAKEGPRRERCAGAYKLVHLIARQEIPHLTGIGVGHASDPESLHEDCRRAGQSSDSRRDFLCAGQFRSNSIFIYKAGFTHLMMS